MILYAAVGRRPFCWSGSIRNRAQTDLRRPGRGRGGAADDVRRGDARRPAVRPRSGPTPCDSALWARGCRAADDRACCRSSKACSACRPISACWNWATWPHPLLQELVRRAPGTYNHSINVASIAEAAAESIGANGLLVRVGAYFHDIGKMLKPGYFVENQGPDGNRHESLRAGHEHAGHHRPHQGRRRPGPAAPPAAADHRLHRAAPRHDAGRVFLSPRQPSSSEADPDAGEVDESDLPLSRPQAADQGSRPC